MRRESVKKQEFEDSLPVRLAYAHGRIEAQIEGLAVSIGIPPQQFAAWLGQLLQGATIRQVLGVAHSMPDLRGTPAATPERIGTLALDDGSHSRETRSGDGDQRKDGVKTHPLKGRKQEWYAKLNKKQKQAIIDKRRASMAKRREEKLAKTA